MELLMPGAEPDFMKAAAARLEVAVFLADNRYTLDSYYLTGYAIECSLKAIILTRTPVQERPATFLRVTSGKSMHNFEVLKDELHKMGCEVPMDLVRLLRRYRWSTNMRYDHTRRPTSEARGFLKAAERVYNWGKEELS
ncbi:MAG: HEPN domain-containing protein [Planctomycetes bacterium]|nr:HEPN domain-containing protein [Planctomycetota bacterium]